jgi:hypothetical protein
MATVSVVSDKIWGNNFVSCISCRCCVLHDKIVCSSCRPYSIAFVVLVFRFVEDDVVRDMDTTSCSVVHPIYLGPRPYTVNTIGVPDHTYYARTVLIVRDVAKDAQVIDEGTVRPCNRFTQT